MSTAVKRRVQNSNELLSVMNADKYNLETRESFGQRQHILKLPPELAEKVVDRAVKKKNILKWKRNCFIVLKYTSVAGGRAQIRLQYNTWLFDRHFEKSGSVVLSLVL